MTKRMTTTLYSGTNDMHSHQVRAVLAEKNVSVDIIYVNEQHPSEDLLDLNPYNTLPTLVDRELVLYNAQIIMEYLDERFPHPPLLPVYPVSRAKSRLMIHRIESDWYHLAGVIERGSSEADQARNELMNALMMVSPVFANSPFFLSEDFTLVDCVIAPLLWRLPSLGLQIPSNAKTKPILQYQDRVFERNAFQASLTDAERELRE